MISAAALQSQMLQTLIAALDSVPALEGGGTLAAKITRLEPGGAIVLSHAGGALRINAAPAEIAASGLEPGDAVLLSREGRNDAVKIVPLARGETPAQPGPPQAAVQGAAAGAANLGQQPKTSTANAPLAASEARAAPAPGPAPLSLQARAITPELIRAAALKQNGLGPLFAALASALEFAAKPDAPPSGPLEKLAGALLDARLPSGAPVEAPAVKSALANSGIFLESKLAAGVPAAIGPDRKALSLALKEEARAISGEAAPPPRAASARPPLQGLPPEAQPSAQSPETLSRAEAAAVIRDAAGAAAERITLQQIASLPDPARAAAAQTLVFEIPLAFGRATAVADFRIEGEGGYAEALERARQWRVKFAVDLEGAGPLHAEIIVSGKSASVALWAERGAAREELNSGSEALRAGLAESGLELARLDIHSGKPLMPPSPSGRILDQVS